MGRFLVRRLLEALVVLLLMSFLIYALIGLMPGDPIDLMISADPNITAEDANRLKALYGLDKPLLVRYGNWLLNALSGDFGYSRLFSQPTLDVLWPRLGNTMILMGAAFVLSISLALLLGLVAARYSGSLLDTALNMFAFAGVSVPPFWLALLLILLFAVTLGWLPAGGMGDGDWYDALKHLVLPVLTLTLASVGSQLRFVRASVREALNQDYVRTARAKGVSEMRMMIGHVLRNAMIPVVTIVALEFGTLFGGALITETMFGWLGMGKTIYDAVMGNDYNLALAGLLLATATVLAANIVADFLYVWLDPRINLE